MPIIKKPPTGIRTKVFQPQSDFNKQKPNFNEQKPDHIRRKPPSMIGASAGQAFLKKLSGIKTDNKIGDVAVSRKTKVFQPQSALNKQKAGLSSDTQVKDVNKIPAQPKATREDIRARNEKASQKQGAFPSTGQTYDPAQALQTQQPGDSPISPYVAGQETKAPEDVTPPALPSSTPATTVPPAVDTSSSVSQATGELTPGFDQMEEDTDVLFDIAAENKDEIVLAEQALHERNIANLAELQAMQEKLAAQKNALIAGSAEIQSLEIEAAYEANAEALRIAKERLDLSQRKVLSEREKQLERKKVNEENMLSLIGGFGSMAGNKMLIDSIEEGEDKMAWLKVEFSLQDQEHSSKVVKLNNDYKNDKLKIEQWKQEQIQNNFENLQSYIENIMKDEMKSDRDKVTAINNARKQYNNTISDIHKTVINGRFELSRDIIKRADDLRAEAEEKQIYASEKARQDIGDARSDLALLAENYSIEDYDTLSDDVKAKFDEVEKASDLPPGFTQAAIENFKLQNKGKDLQIRFEKNDQGDLTVIGVDKKTGMIVATSSALGVGKTKSTKASTPMEKAFGVGTEGGWCGDYASRVSTASKVGNTWESKISKVTHRENPTPGDKIVIPLGVTDSGSDFGHVAVVLAYNTETGDIQVTESNKDGRQTRGEGQGIITMGEYNINDLNEQYAENWGFIKGDLKGDYAKQAVKLGLVDKKKKEEEDNDMSWITG